MDRSRASSTAGSEAISRRSLMMARRRRPPPRFQPYMIIILVLAGGLVLIGLTLTIVGLWPTYSSSGGNVLQIVGPIMLATGIISIIGISVRIAYLRNKEREKIMRSISDMRSSRMTIASYQTQPVTPTPSVHARPSKGILKAPSTSTYNGTVRGGSTGDFESDSGMANTHSFSTNRSYERDSDASDTSRGPEHIKVEMMPDPTAYRHGKPVDQSSTGSDQGVPPASVHTPSRGYGNNQRPPTGSYGRQSRSKPTYSNQAYSPDARETDIDGDLNTSHQRRQMQNYSQGGFDAYDARSTPLTGQGSIVGGGALGSSFTTPSPAAPAPQQQQQQQQRTRWGSKSPRSPATSQTNGSYSGGGVATVSEMYQEATAGYGTPSQRHYTSYAHSGGGTPAARNTPSSSTEV